MFKQYFEGTQDNFFLKFFQIFFFPKCKFFIGKGARFFVRKSRLPKNITNLLSFDASNSMKESRKKHSSNFQGLSEGVANNFH